MLRKRVITALTFNDGVLFRTKRFIPDYRYTQAFVDTWSVDEIVALDVTPQGSGCRNNFLSALNNLADSSVVPLSAGGKIRSLDDAKELLDAGADKLVVNSAAIESPRFVTDLAQRYGSQCVVAGIDVRLTEGTYQVVSDNNSKVTTLSPVSWAKELERLGAGEIFLQSVDRDGSLEGYDNVLNKMVTSAVSIPVIVAGGAGKWEDFVEGFNEGGASAVCTTCIYHFTENSISSAKEYLHEAGIFVRI